MTTIKIRGGTAAQWASANPTLAAREPGVETDTGVYKVGDGSTAWSSLSPVLNNTYAQTFKPEKYGAVGDGTTDDSAAVIAAIAAAYAAGGGTVEFGPKTYRINSQLAIPNDGHATLPRQPPIRMVGAGSARDGAYGTNTQPGATVLDLRSTTGPAKIDTRGLGDLTIERIVLTQKGSAADTNPFMQTTNTTLITRDVAFWGYSTLTGATCVQDAVVYGGTGTTLGGTSAAPFQGYGSAMEGCFFARIRRGAYLRAYANSIRIVGNVWSTSCGATSSEAAVHLDGSAAVGQSATGNFIVGNLFETTNYVYVVRFFDAQKNVATGNQFWDAGAGLLACFLVEATGNAQANSARNRMGSSFPGITGSKHIVDTTTGTSYIVEDDANSLFVMSGILAATGAGQALLDISQSGKIAIGDASSSAAYLSIKNGSEETWFGSTGVIQPTSGVNLDLYAGGNNDAVRIRRGKLQLDAGMKHSNGLTWTTGTGSPEGVLTAPVGSLYSRSDGGAGTSLYVKETGSGNTGWVGK